MKSLSAVLSVILVVTSSLHASPTPDASHLVSIEELRDQVSARATKRANNIHEVQTLLRHEEVNDRLGHLFDLEKIAGAVPKLDDKTLAKLARESKQMNDQVRAGMSRKEAIIWVVVIVASVIIGLLFYNYVVAKSAEAVGSIYD